jgi:hypothetical protein
MRECKIGCDAIPIVAVAVLAMCAADLHAIFII